VAFGGLDEASTPCTTRHGTTTSRRGRLGGECQHRPGALPASWNAYHNQPVLCVRLGLCPRRPRKNGDKKGQTGTNGDTMRSSISQTHSVARSERICVPPRSSALTGNWPSEAQKTEHSLNIHRHFEAIDREFGITSANSEPTQDALGSSSPAYGATAPFQSSASPTCSTRPQMLIVREAGDVVRRELGFRLVPDGFPATSRHAWIRITQPKTKDSITRECGFCAARLPSVWDSERSTPSASKSQPRDSAGNAAFTPPPFN
jgi:hypothetical protein